MCSHTESSIWSFPVVETRDKLSLHFMVFESQVHTIMQSRCGSVSINETK